MGGNWPVFLRRFGGRADWRSAHGEYEITDLNRSYLADGSLQVERLGRGFAWFDAGTHVSLLEAAEFVSVLQRRQNQLIAAPEEIASRTGWISERELARHVARLSKTEYGMALARLLPGPISKSGRRLPDIV